MMLFIFERLDAKPLQILRSSQELSKKSELSSPQTWISVIYSQRVDSPGRR